MPLLSLPPGAWMNCTRALTAATLLLVPIGVFIACGGDSGGSVTPPAPVVTTVEVSPSPVTVPAHESTQLTAVVKDQHGAVMGGKTPTWSTSAASVATVSTTGLVTGVSLGAATITAMVDGKSGDASVTVTSAARIVLDTGHAATASIGFAGGTVTATSSANLVYELAIPPGALDQATAITVAPLKAFNELPLSGGLVGAVALSPDGQTFRSPVTLTIHATPNVSAGQRLVGFSYASNGDNLRLQPAALVAGKVVLSITHFSGAGAALASVQDLATLPPPPNSSAQDTALVALAGLALPADQAAIVAALQQWQVAILARLALANSDVAARDARLEAAEWVAQLNAYPLPDVTALRTALAADLSALRTSLAAALLRGIASANQQCTAQQSLVAARNALFLQAAAETDSIAPSGSALSRVTVLAGLCVHPVVVDSLYPQSPQINVSAPLDLRVGLAFVNAAPVAVQTVSFGLSIGVSGSTNDRSFTASTNASGQFSFTVAPTGAATLQVSVTACPDPATFLFNYPCVAFALARTFGRTINGNTVITTQAGLDSLSDVSKVVGNLTIGSSNITSADLRELGQLSEVTGTLALANMANVTTLTGLKGVSKLGGLRISTLPSLTNLQGLEGVGGTLQSLLLTNLPLLTALDPLAGILSIGDLQVATLPLVSTLTGLGAATITRGLGVSGMAALTGLDEIGAVAPTLDGSIVLTGNPKLTDLGPLRSVTTVQGNLNLLGNPVLEDVSGLDGLVHVGTDVVLQFPTGSGPFHFSGLSGLQTIGGDIQLAGSSLTQFAALSSLQTVGGTLTIFTRLLPLVPDLQFPALATVDGGITIDNSVCDPAATTKLLNFPALLRASEVSIAGPSVGPVPASCAMALDLSALQAIGPSDPTQGTGDLVLTGESLTSLKVGPLSRIRDFGVTQPNGIPSTHLTNLTFSNITGRQLAVGGQAALQALSVSTVSLTQGINIGANPALTFVSLSGVTINSLSLADLPALTSVSASGSGLTHASFSNLVLSQTQIFNLVKALGFPSGNNITIDGVVVQVP